MFGLSSLKKVTFFFGIIFLISCSQEKIKSEVANNEQSINTSRQIAQAYKIADKVFLEAILETKVGQSLLSDASRVNLEKVFRNESSLYELERLIKSTKPGSSYDKGVFTFVKNKGQSLTLKENGKVVSNSISLNFTAFSSLKDIINTAQNKYISINENGKREVYYSVPLPGSSGSAEFRFHRGEIIENNWAEKSNEKNAYLGKIASELKKNGFSTSEVRIMKSLEKLVSEKKYIQYITNECGGLNDSSKESLANILEDLEKSDDPSSLLQLQISYGKVIGVNQEEAEQILAILKNLNCGLNVSAYHE